MVRRKCALCGERDAKYWSKNWQRIRRSRDHDLCKKCRRKVQDAYDALVLADREAAMVSTALLNRLRDYIAGSIREFQTQSDVEAYVAARNRERESLLAELDRIISERAALPDAPVSQADGAAT